MEYISYYQKDSREITNQERGKSRKLASLRSFYNYFYQIELIEKNPAVLIPMPKLHQKEIIRLDADEVAILLDQVEDGTNLTKSQKNIMRKQRSEILLCLRSCSEQESVYLNALDSIWRMWTLKIMELKSVEREGMKPSFILEKR